MVESRITNQRPGARIRDSFRRGQTEGADMGRADPGYDTTPPNADALNRRTNRARVDDLMRNMPAAPIEMTVTAPPVRRRPTTRREMSADDLNDMMLARMRGEAAPANESAARQSARENIARATPGFKKGGLIGTKPKPKAAAYKKGGPVKSAKRKK